MLSKPANQLNRTSWTEPAERNQLYRTSWTEPGYQGLVGGSLRAWLSPTNPWCSTSIQLLPTAFRDGIWNNFVILCLWAKWLKICWLLTLGHIDWNILTIDTIEIVHGTRNHLRRLILIHIFPLSCGRGACCTSASKWLLCLIYEGRQLSLPGQRPPPFPVSCLFMQVSIQEYARSGFVALKNLLWNQAKPAALLIITKCIYFIWWGRFNRLAPK